MGRIFKLAALLVAMAAATVQAQTKDTMATIFDFTATASNGKEINFKDFEGKVLLIVNTASKCGFTPQFDGLEKLNEAYRDRGLVVIGFPCNQFANQDPGSDSEIEGFCRVNYGVTFQIMKKVDVNGAEEHPVFTFLKQQAPTEEVHGLKAKVATAAFSKMSKSVEKPSDVKWNFTKFLVARDGTTVERFAPTTEPEKIESAIEKLL